MRIFKTENGLAVDLPQDVVVALHLAEGDALDIRKTGQRSATIEKALNPDEIIAKLRSLRRPLPAGYVFNREEANER